MEQEYRWIIAEPASADVSELQQAGHLTRPAALILANRNIAPDRLHSFLHPDLSNLTDPYQLPGTFETAERLWKAILNGENILVHGDYDTDGITASTLVTETLQKNGARVHTFLPHRIDDGYGVTEESIEKATETDTSVLLTVDCGITAHEGITKARGRGIDVLITDHHEPRKELPAANTVVDPKLPGTPESLIPLAGVGVAFKVCHAFLKYGKENGLLQEKKDIPDGLDLVAMGTIADIVPLMEENRTLVKFGLESVSKQLRPGLYALCETTGLSAPIRPRDITFNIAPRCNAAGRLGQPELTMQLLQSTSMREATRLAKNLENANDKRRQLESDATENVNAQLNEWSDMAARRTIVVAGRDWHQGILGIVASRLVRAYYRPTVVLANTADGLLTGSVRSTDGLNIVNILSGLTDHLESYGGHALAAGLTLPPDNLEAFREAFEEKVRAYLAQQTPHPPLEICGDVGFEEIDGQFFQDMQRLEPFGHGHPEPIFRSPPVNPERMQPAGNEHTRGRLRDTIGGRSLEFIAFGRTPEAFPPPPWEVTYKPSLNTYKGRSKPQAEILDVRTYQKQNADSR